jgi:hypothetical protein
MGDNSFWQDIYNTGQRREGRFKSLFYPYWDSKLNVAGWPDDWKPDLEELRLLENYGPLGLELKHLAFRRQELAGDRHLRRHPEHFGVWYPFDDQTCWPSSIGAIFGSHMLDRHNKPALVPWEPPLMRYAKARGDAKYVIGVDPCGFAARDHAAVQVLEVWRGEWRQVAAFADHVDPLKLTTVVLKLAREFNNALVVVESNGVGQAVLAMLLERQYNNVFYEKRRKPGFTSTVRSVVDVTAWIQDALLEELVMFDPDTLSQLRTYRNDKGVEESPRMEQLRGGLARGRRDRHHWDKVSALGMAIVGARSIPQRPPPWSSPDKATNLIEFRPYTFDERADLFKKRRKRKRYWLSA